MHKEFIASYTALRAEETITKKVRKRKPSNRIDAVLQTTHDVLLFVLRYLKNNPTQEAHAAAWGMYQGQAHPHLQFGLRVVRRTLMHSDMLPARNNIDLAERREVLSRDKRKKMRLDATERQIERPSNPQEQRQMYSGKKRHALKNLLVNDADNHVHFLRHTFPGSVHDKRCADTIDFLMPEETEVFQDTGFQGLTIANVSPHQPTKKPRVTELTSEQKQRNRAISRERMPIEHSIGGAKVFRIVKETLRLGSAWFRDILMEVCVGLAHFKNYRRRAPY
ncbi:MAG: transposase family protein [Candidatus Kapaibacterium sp.]|nr:MAG: transposase family protein [Candidatus Kapabacteria bacterium]